MSAPVTPAVANAAAEDGGWKFAQCFGDKEEVEEVTEGTWDGGVCIVEGARYDASLFCSINAVLLCLLLMPWRLVCPTATHHGHYSTADIISAVEFDRTGDYLATGDRGGRVVLFERNKQVRASAWCIINVHAMPCR